MGRAIVGVISDQNLSYFSEKRFMFVSGAG